MISDLRGSGGPILAVSMANLAPGNTAAAGLLALNQAPDVEAAGKAAAAAVGRRLGTEIDEIRKAATAKSGAAA